MPASSTTVAALAAAINLFRCRKRHLVGAAPQGSSENDRAGLRDAGEERLVAHRVEPVDAAGEEGHGGSAARQRGSVRHPVDAVGAARDDREPAIDETRSGFHRHVFAVSGCGTCPDQRDRGHGACEGAGASAYPDRQRCVHAQLVEAGRPLGVARDHEPGADPRGLREGSHEGRVVEAGPPAFEPGGGLAFVEVLARLVHRLDEEGRCRRPEQQLGRLPCSDCRDGASEDAVSGFGHRAEHRSRERLGSGILVVGRLDGSAESVGGPARRRVRRRGRPPTAGRCSCRDPLPR